MDRLPVVADKFYPGNPRELCHYFEENIPVVTSRRSPAKLVVVPHAGYVYSGAVVGETLVRVEVPQTVVLLGPNHHGQGAPVALSDEDWLTPMGRVPFAAELARFLLQDEGPIVIDNGAHTFEHSLEVQLPFLQFFQEDLAILALTISHLTLHHCQDVASRIAQAIRLYGKPVLLLASTDMTHYESRSNAVKKDTMALEHVRALDPTGLYTTVTSQKISMCGFIPTCIGLMAALELGADTAELVRYTDSGAVSGDINQVVGYAGLNIL